MPLPIVFQSYHGNSPYYSCLSWVSPVLGWYSEVTSPEKLPQKKPQRIKWASNAGQLDYKSNTY